MTTEPPDVKNWLGEDPTNEDKLLSVLKPYITVSPHFGRCLKHPLVFQVPIFYSWKLANEEYKAKAALLDKRFKARDYAGALWLYERPYRITTLVEWVTDGWVKDEAFKTLLLEVWQDTEMPGQWPKDYLVRLFRRAGFISDNSQIQPTEPVTVYRGVTDKRYRRGLSWTTDLEKARWFARRYNDVDTVGYVYETTVKPRYILAFI